MHNLLDTMSSISILGATLRIRLTTEATGGAYSLIEMTVPARFPIAPPHHHTQFTERFVVIDGEIEAELNGVSQRLRAGDSAVATPGIRHSLRNASDNPASLLLIASPGGHEHFFHELIDWMNREPQWPPADRSQLIAFGLRHDTYYA